jgi:hypothetical protein
MLRIVQEERKTQIHRELKAENFEQNQQHPNIRWYPHGFCHSHPPKYVVGIYEIGVGGRKDVNRHRFSQKLIEGGSRHITLINTKKIFLPYLRKT